MDSSRSNAGGFLPENADKIADLIRKSHRIVFFGGAGVSTESGVKDYRSEDGLYNTVKEYKVSPETILSHSFFMRNTDVFYDFYRKYFVTDCDKIKPNKAHLALAKLEQAVRGGHPEHRRPPPESRQQERFRTPRHHFPLPLHEMPPRVLV